MLVTVALPVRDGERHLDEVLAAVAAQRTDAEVEVLVADSGSRDRSVEIARRHGARVLEVRPDDFSHGATRNLLVREARGERIAFLTQDAVPASDGWLAALLAGFEEAEDVGLVYGPYRPRPGASHMVRRELEEWFGSLAPDGRPRVDRLAPGEPLIPGPTFFFTDADGCVARAAWQRVPFRDVPYAEDQLLAIDMLRAGYAKVFAPEAAVVHSHDYPPLRYARRTFDEFRALREVYGWVEPAGPRSVAHVLRRRLAADWRFLRREKTGPAALAAGMARSLAHWSARAAGATAGSRADRIPPRVRRRLSLEGRAEFTPVEGERG